MIPATARRNGDGSISFPCRGDPPVCDEPGYVEDPNDPYHWLMVYCDCKLRVLQKEVMCSRSGRMRKVDYCSRLMMQINPIYCNQDCPISKAEKI